jgi:hypothetical protein
MNVKVNATAGGFLESPSRRPAPELILGENESSECTAQLIITAYSDRHTLDADTRAKLEEAYQIIKNTPDLSSLNAAIRAIAESKGISVTDLAVSDLFDIRYMNCGDHEKHGYFDITLKSDTLKNFVCLLHYYNGEWRIVENAEVTNNGTHLEFYEKEFSPFAIVVNTAEAGSGNSGLQTGDNSMIYVASAVVSGFLLLILMFKFRRERA